MKLTFLTSICCLILSLSIRAQQPSFTKTSIKWDLGFGYHDGKNETGFGLLSAIGIQREYGKHNRWRLNPNLMIGYFFPPTDVANSSYSLVGINTAIHYDLLRYKAISLVTSANVFTDYTSGKTRQGYSYLPTKATFNNFYYGAGGTLGFRINEASQSRALNINLINYQFGNNQFELGYLTVGLDFKLRK